jgi:hypothetical protein
MKSHSAGTIPCIRIDVVIGVFALAAAWQLPLCADKSSDTIRANRPAKRQTNDAHDLEIRLRAQRVVDRKAEAEYHIAQLAYVIAEIEIQQYIESIFPQELANANAEIKRAESDLKRTEDRLDWLRNNSYKGFPHLPTTTDELRVKKARFALEQAVSKKLVLAEYTKGKRTRELEAEADKARAAEVAKKRAWELEKLKQSVIEQQIAQWQPVFTKRDDVKRSPSGSINVFARFWEGEPRSPGITQRHLGGAFRDEA